MAGMEAFEVLGEPVRRRVLEHLAHGGEVSAGGLVSLVRAEFGISQPAVSQHLRTLRDAGLVTVRPDGTRRIYALREEPLADAERWLADLRGFWSQRLDALETELARGHRQRRRSTRPGEHDAPGHDRPTKDAAPAAHDPRRMA
jgi:DNA-binding transcriptional ArsR family regulator